MQSTFTVQSKLTTTNAASSSTIIQLTPTTLTDFQVDTRSKSSTNESDKVTGSLATSSNLSTSAKSSPEPSSTAFFSVNTSDHVITYFDQTYRHYMIHTCLPTPHFIHSDSYKLFQNEQNQNFSQHGENNSYNASTFDSVCHHMRNVSTNNANPVLSQFESNALSSTPLFGQVIDKEYCQAKKPNNRFNVSLGTKFYRVRVKPWKPSILSSSN